MYIIKIIIKQSNNWIEILTNRKVYNIIKVTDNLNLLIKLKTKIEGKNTKKFFKFVNFVIRIFEKLLII